MKLCPTNGWRRGPMKPLLALDFFLKKNSLQTVRILIVRLSLIISH